MIAIEKEVAEEDFSRFCESMGLEPESISEQKEKLVSSIESGRLSIDDDGIAELTSKDGKLFKFREADGATILAMDSAPEDKSMAKLFAAMVDLCQTEKSAFSKMKISDLKICFAITNCFLLQLA